MPHRPGPRPRPPAPARPAEYHPAGDHLPHSWRHGAMLAFRRPARLLGRARRPAALISAGGLLATALLGGAAQPAAATAPTAAFHGYSVFEIPLSGIESS